MALGEKRNGSVFATAAQRRDAAEYQVTSEPEVVPVVVDDTPQRTLNTDIGALRQAHNLFFTPSAEGRDFNSVLQEVQEYISGAYAALITEGGEDSKEQLMRYITKYLQDRRIAVAGMTQTELVDAIYSEMAEFGFLTRYIYADGIEEININSWRDIEVQYSDGRSEKLTEHFDSPEHALAVIRRMLHASGMVLDNASPLVTGHLTRNTRIAAMKSPVVDEDVGVAASIRIVNRHNLSREDLLRSGTATEEMLFNILSFLSDKLLTEGNTVAALDELYIWLSNPTAIEYIRNCLKRVRKKESAMLLASQNLEDFDQEGIREMTKPLFSIPPHQFLFNAGSIDKRSYMEMLQLDEAEYNLIKFPQRGVCLYKCGNERYLLEVHAPAYKEKLFGTAGGR